MEFNGKYRLHEVRNVLDKYHDQIKDYWKEEYLSMVDVLESAPNTNRPRRISPEKLAKLRNQELVREHKELHDQAVREAAYELDIDRSQVWDIRYTVGDVIRAEQQGSNAIQRPVHKPNQRRFINALATIGRLTVDIPLVSPATRGRYTVSDIQSIYTGAHRDLGYFAESPYRPAHTLGVAEELQVPIQEVIAEFPHWGGSPDTLYAPNYMSLPAFLGTLATLEIVTGGNLI